MSGPLPRGRRPGSPIRGVGLLLALFLVAIGIAALIAAATAFLVG